MGVCPAMMTVQRMMRSAARQHNAAQAHQMSLTPGMQQRPATWQLPAKCSFKEQHPKHRHSAQVELNVNCKEHPTESNPQTRDTSNKTGAKRTDRSRNQGKPKERGSETSQTALPNRPRQQPTR